MSNKIEFTESAKKEIDRVVSEKGAKYISEFLFKEVDVLVLNIISPLTIKLLPTIVFSTKL